MYLEDNSIIIILGITTGLVCMLSLFITLQLMNEAEYLMKNMEIEEGFIHRGRI